MCIQGGENSEEKIQNKRYDNIYGFIDNRIEYLDYFFESEQQIK